MVVFNPGWVLKFVCLMLRRDRAQGLSSVCRRESLALALLKNSRQFVFCNSFSNALAASAEEAGFWPVISNPSILT